MTSATLYLAREPDTRESANSQLRTYYDARHEVMWCYMHASPRPCFSPELLGELRQYVEEVVRQVDDPKGMPIRFMVLASDVPGVFNLGGDLNLFRNLILARDRDGLLHYARTCIDVLHPHVVNLNRDITTISLVQGDALGGGFEAALSSNVLIAERSTKMGLPEILFNLFPGMGAYSLLARKLDSARAQRLILSGKLYGAEELYEMGIVDVLAEDGEGERAIYRYIAEEGKRRNGHRALREAMKCYNPVTYEELMQIATVWVDAALRLNDRDLRVMQRLVMRQSMKSVSAA